MHVVMHVEASRGSVGEEKNCGRWAVTCDLGYRCMRLGTGFGPGAAVGPELAVCLSFSLRGAIWACKMGLWLGYWAQQKYQK